MDGNPVHFGMARAPLAGKHVFAKLIRSVLISSVQFSCSRTCTRRLQGACLGLAEPYLNPSEPLEGAGTTRTTKTRTLWALWGAPVEGSGPLFGLGRTLSEPFRTLRGGWDNQLGRSEALWEAPGRPGSSQSATDRAKAPNPQGMNRTLSA